VDTRAAPNRSDAVSRQDDKIIFALLDYFDFVCHTALQKQLDIETIVTLIGGRMRSALQLFEGKIPSGRDVNDLGATASMHRSNALLKDMWPAGMCRERQRLSL
jgi:hypothetical protein